MILKGIQEAVAAEKKLLAVLIDPDKFDLASTVAFIQKIPGSVSHIFVGGSTVAPGLTEALVKMVKHNSPLPVVLFPGSYTQITEEADALLFLSLLSGRNPEYLIEQQVKAVARLKAAKLEIIPTAYLLIDGGTESAVQRVSQTTPISQSALEEIRNTALAGEYLGKKLIYLEAGSGARYPVGAKVISEVRAVTTVPLIVGGGIRSKKQLEEAYSAGADMVVIGNALES